MILAVLVDVKALLKVVWVSLVAGVGVIAAYSLVVLGATRADDLRRRDRPASALLYGFLAVVGAAGCAFALWRGYLFVVEK